MTGPETNRNESSPSELLARLRTDWPDWGFLLVGGRWFGIHGRRLIINAVTAAELRSQLPTRPPHDSVPR